jgi:hypothetical protein
LAASWLTVQFYALPFLMEQEQKHLGLALRNGLFTAFSAPGYTLVVAGLAILIGVLSVGFVLPLMLGGPALIASLGARAVLDRIETYRVREKDATSKEETTSES